MGEPGKTYASHMGSIEGVDLFDPSFFKVSPREAHALDPQQRLLLKTTWHAFESANLDVYNCESTSVFVGVCNNDYAKLALTQGRYDHHLLSGTSHSVLAGRVSFTFGFHGPSMTVDTACSSSSVALHLAVQSLRKKESKTSVVAGVNLILGVESMIGCCSMKMLSPDGECRTFDDSANGYVRGEGCGVLILKRLSEALSDGDNVLAIIKGTAVNQDKK